MKILSLGLCVALAACGGNISGADGGTDAASDGTTQNDGGADGGNFDGGGPDSGNTCTCAMGLVCCNGACINKDNDPHNCGGCGSTCNASEECFAGMCVAPMCQPACAAGSICCEMDGPGPTASQCQTGDTCPVGCPLCN